MSEQRKSSDLLIELEQNINSILGYLKNHDQLLKLINNKLAVLNKSNILPSENIEKTVGKSMEVKPIMPGLKPGIVMTSVGLGRVEENIPTISSSQSIQVPSQEKIEAGEQIEVIKEPKGKRRTARYSEETNSKSKKTAVQQRIMYNDGKNVCLANVEIFDNSNNLVKQLRTNAMGKWIAALDPGDYVININKQGVLNKSDVDLSFEINIPESDRPMELQEIQIK